MPARDDRDLPHRVGARREHADDRVPALVVRGAAAVLVAHHHLPLGAEHDPLERVGEVGLEHLLVAAARREQRRLVDEVREVGADHARRGRGDPAEIDVRRRAAPSACAPRGSPRGRSGRAAARRRAGRTARAAGAPGRARRAGSSPRSRSRRSTESKPSISVRIWFSVCSRSSLPPLKPATPEVRERPIASSSSMKTIAGAASFACLNRSRTREAPIADDRLDELRRRHREERRVRLARDCAGEQRLARFPAGRRAARRAGSAPRASRYFSGWRRKSTTSVSSALASSIPATSAKVTGSSPRLVAPGARAAEARRASPARSRRGASAARAARRTGSSARSRAAGSPTTGRCRVSGFALTTTLLLLEQVRQRLRVGERRDLGLEVASRASSPRSSWPS